MRTSKGTAERRPTRRFCVAQNLPHVPADVVNRLDAQTMLGVLGQIDEGYRAPLVLYYSEDLSYKEIADVLEIPLGTVQSRIARGKMHLFQLLTETHHSSCQST